PPCPGSPGCPAPRGGTVRWRSWLPEGCWAYGRHMWRETWGHSAGRARPTRPWQCPRDAQRARSSAPKVCRALASAVAVRWGERAVVVGGCAPPTPGEGGDAGPPPAEGGSALAEGGDRRPRGDPAGREGGRKASCT